MRAFLRCALLAVGLGLAGCTTTSMYTQERLARDDMETINVHAKDGSVIRFGPREYAVSRDSISGAGEVVTNSVSNSTAHWMGSIAFDEIESVTVTEFNLLGNAMYLSAIVGMIVGIRVLTGDGGSQ